MKSHALHFLFLLGACFPAHAQLKTVPYVDAARYVGTWYQIARNPHPFEAGCVCARQVLTPVNADQISVYNSCNDKTPNGPVKEIRGIASNDEPATNSKFTVDFGLPNKGQYWIIGLDSQYRYAVVSEPSKKTLYILSKTPDLSADLYDEAVAEAGKQVDVSQLTLTLQKGCSYPAPLMTKAVTAPMDQAHPGSKKYPFAAESKSLTCQGRDVTVFLPKGGVGKLPAVVYGHGQALGLDNYRGTLEHLAKKGVAAIFPTYDNGFLDQDWPRMGRDYVNLTDCAIAKTGELIDRGRITFSGHSKGAYVASIAAGLTEKENLPVRPQSVILMETAGFDSVSAANVSESTSVTVVYSDKDTVVGRNLSQSFYDSVKSKRKQFIFMKSYPNGPNADHQWPLTQGGFFGGGNEGPLHYFGAWKWLTASALGLDDYLYGNQAGDKGDPNVQDEILRNF